MRIIAIHHLLARSYKTTFVLFWIYRPVDGWKHASGYTKFPPLKPFWGQISEVDGFSLHLCFQQEFVYVCYFFRLTDNFSNIHVRCDCSANLFVLLSLQYRHSMYTLFHCVRIYDDNVDAQHLSINKSNDSRITVGRRDRRSFPVAASMFWNTQQDDIQSAPSVSAFQKHSKNISVPTFIS